jgi:hypothetical protein
MRNIELTLSGSTCLDGDHQILLIMGLVRGGRFDFDNLGDPPLFTKKLPLYFA